VYSGLDLDSAMTPLFFGWLLDRGEPRLVLVVSAVLMVLTIATVLQIRRRASPRTVTVSARRRPPRSNSPFLDIPGTPVTSHVLRVTRDIGNFLDRR